MFLSLLVLARLAQNFLKESKSFFPVESRLQLYLTRRATYSHMHLTCSGDMHPFPRLNSNVIPFSWKQISK